jgi:hypothetical protein
MKARWLLFGGTVLALTSCFDFEGYTLKTTTWAEDCMTFCAKKEAANCSKGVGIYDTCEEECAPSKAQLACQSQYGEQYRCQATQATVSCDTVGYPVSQSCTAEQELVAVCVFCQLYDADHPCGMCMNTHCCGEETLSAWSQCRADRCSTACTPPGVGTVECGNMACSDICCVSQTVSGQWTGTCVSDWNLCCSSTSCLAVGCDGPEDCDAGDVCCHFSNSDGAVAQCTSITECQSGSATGYTCHEDLDCLGTHRCTGQSPYLPVKLCSSG